MERFFISQKNNNTVTVGGVRVLSEFSAAEVVVGVPGGTVLIRGEKLKIAAFDENEICVLGKIINVETVSKGARRV